MKAIIIFISLLGNSKVLICQNQFYKSILDIKIEIAEDVISKVKSLQNSIGSTYTCVFSSSTRKATVLRSVGYNGILLENIEKDSVFYNKIKQFKNDSTIVYSDKANIETYRYDDIYLMGLSNKDTCKSCPRVYFELNSPIEGWENIDLFLISNIKPKDIDTSFYEDYYINTISIPVFIHTLKNNKHHKESLIFIYELDRVKKWKFIKKVRLL